MTGRDKKTGDIPVTQTGQPDNKPNPAGWQAWVNLALLFLVLEIAVLSIEQARWITPQPSLTLVLILSLATAWLFIWKRLPGIVAHIAALIIGGGITAWQAYQLSIPEVRPFATFLVILTWLMGYTSAWWLMRRRNAWVAACLGAVVVLVNLSNLPENYYYFFGLYFIAAVFLITWNRMVKRRYLAGRIAGSARRGLVYLVTSLLCMVIVASLVARIIPEMRIPQLQTLVATKMLWKKDVERSSFNFFAAVPAKQPMNTNTTLRDLPFKNTWNDEDRINFLVKSPEPLYWRVGVYDTYTSRGWTNRPTSDYVLEEDESWDGAAALTGRDEVTYTVTASIKTDVLLTAGDYISSDTTTLVRVSDGDVISVTTPRVLSAGEHYTVTSSISSPTPGELSSVEEGYPVTIANQYLRLPASFPDTVRLLSENITRDAMTPYEKITALDEYLSQFPYEEEIKAPPVNTDGVEYFLFTQKSGFCLYYASAMVVMLRSVDVPARLAIGYLPGDPGEGEGEYILRDKHYHTWPQAYFTGYGWVDLEATPRGTGSPVAIETPWISAGAMETYPQSGSLEQWQALQMYGWPYGFTMAETFEQPARIKGPPAFADELGQAVLIIFTIAVVLGILAIPVWILRSAFYRWLWRVDRAHLASTVYAKMCNLTSRVGLGPRPQQTPREFAFELAAEFPDQAEAIDDITRAYVENRFGHREGKPGLYEEAEILKARHSVYQSLLNRLGRVRTWFMMPK